MSEVNVKTNSLDYSKNNEWRPIEKNPCLDIPDTTKRYVVMVDTFMSGWGEATDKQSVYCIECTGCKETIQIYEAAMRREEMQFVHIRHTPPKELPSTLVTMKTFEQLGGSWKE